jgi:hypoxanthine phosphoribosyltransferase
MNAEKPKCYLVVDWNDVERALKRVVCAIYDDVRPEVRDSMKNLVTIERGGLVPTRMLMDMMNLDNHHVHVIDKRYFLDPNSNMSSFPGVSGCYFYVDDIYDTGTTTDKILELARYSRKDYDTIKTSLFMAVVCARHDYNWNLYKYHEYDDITVFVGQVLSSHLNKHHVIFPWEKYQFLTALYQEYVQKNVDLAVIETNNNSWEHFSQYLEQMVEQEILAFGWRGSPHGLSKYLLGHMDGSLAHILLKQQ